MPDTQTTLTSIGDAFIKVEESKFSTHAYVFASGEMFAQQIYLDLDTPTAIPALELLLKVAKNAAMRATR